MLNFRQGMWGREAGGPATYATPGLSCYWEGAREYSARIINGTKKQKRAVGTYGVSCGLQR